MKMRTRKLIGTFAVPAWIAAFALLVMSFGGQYIVGNGVYVELAFFVIAGLGWIPVAMWIIRWMSKADPS